MNTEVLQRLSFSWRAEAERFRRLGQEAQARMAEAYAEELEEAVAEEGEALLSLTEAARETGYSAAHLGRLVRDDKIPNYGRPNAPRVRRADLPRKTLPNTPVESNVYSSRPEQIVRSIVNR